MSRRPLTTLFLCLTALPACGADHLDSPSVGADGRLDLNDVYAFQSPTDLENTVLIMTVNPGAGVLSETTFNARGTYEFHIDNNGDAVSDISFSFYFSRPRRGRQSFLVLRENQRVFAFGRTERDFRTRGGGKVRVGLFDDPFFFDLNGFNNGFSFTGDDFFAALDVSAIVLEVPSNLLGGPNIGVWARTVERRSQFDRMGRPAINTALIPSELKDAFNRGQPVDDPADFGETVQASIASLNGGDTETAALLTGILLPDVLTVDTSNSAGFLNGRQLANDVIDAELSLLTNGAVTGDGVDQNDVAFRNVFPYLAEPHSN